MIAPAARPTSRHRGANACRSCGSAVLHTFARASGVPVKSTEVFATREEALRVPLGELELALCERCGFIQNACFDPAFGGDAPIVQERPSGVPTFRHTLEYVQDVSLLLRRLRASLTEANVTQTIIEVSDVRPILRRGAFWELCYERCSYFSPGSLARLLRREGFIVEDVRHAVDGRDVVLEARIAPEGTPAPPQADVVEEGVDELARDADAYRGTIDATITGWRRCIGAARSRGRVAVWGSGPRCVAFLSASGLGRSFDAVVDADPDRQHRFLPASALRIDPPETLARVTPDLVVATDATELEEVEERLARMGVDAAVEAL